MRRLYCVQPERSWNSISPLFLLPGNIPALLCSFVSLICQLLPSFFLWPSLFPLLNDRLVKNRLAVYFELHSKYPLRLSSCDLSLYFLKPIEGLYDQKNAQIPYQNPSNAWQCVPMGMERFHKNN